MSPDVEWRIGEEAEQEIVVAATPRQAGRWRALGLALAVSLGIVLGVMYRSVPEPPPRPTPTPIPTPAPPPPPQVTDAIERESIALATGDLRAFMDLQDPADSTWRHTQLGLFRTWGDPTDGSLYTTVETGTLTGDRSWADVIQFRNDQYFRQTRFYQLQNDRWRRIAPVTDMSFWGEAQSSESAHFHLTFRAKDAVLAEAVAQQYEAIYARLCGDLQCPERAALPAERKLQIVLGPEVTTPIIDLQSDQLVYTLPSPRISGLYFLTRRGNQPSPDRAFSQSVVESILYYVARASASQLSTWPKDISSEQLLEVIVEWERLRLTDQPTPKLLYRPDQLASHDLPDLATLWAVPPIDPPNLSELRRTVSTALITFIDEKYGADKVIALLHTLGQASSLRDAVKLMGLSYDDFERQWRSWLDLVAMPTPGEHRRLPSPG